MYQQRWVKLGLFLAEGDPYARWGEEVLDHSGLPYKLAKQVDEIDGFDVAVLFGRGTLSLGEQAQIVRWVRTGGRLVVCGSTWGLDALLGVEAVDAPETSRGHVSPGPRCERLWPAGCAPALYFGGARVKAGSACVALVTDRGDVAAARNGNCTFIAPHLGQTLALMTLGRSVECDAVGPGDGSVTLEDGVLRAEDGTNLCYSLDRTAIDGPHAPAFLNAHADTVRQIFVRAVFEAVESTGLPGYATWRWPYNYDKVSAVTVDCDDGLQDNVMDVVRPMSNYGQPACWLARTPGLPQELYRMFRNWRHSTGLLFHFDSAKPLAEQLRAQAVQIGRGAGAPLLTFRPEDGKWIGLTRLYQAAEDAKFALSTGKGGVQKGSTGFLFGTCLLQFPVSPDSTRHAVAELPYAVHRPGEVTAPLVAQRLIQEVERQNGCLHASVRLSSAKAQENGLIDLMMRAKETKFGMFTPDALVEYELCRRSLRINPAVDGLRIVSSKSQKGLTLMFFGGGWQVETKDRRYSPVAVERFGTIMSSIVLDLQAKTQIALTMPGRVAA